MWPTLRAWMRNPRRMGTVVPSSRWLARAMAREALRGDPRVLLEVGAGSGVVTKALLGGLHKDQRLLVVDMDRSLLGHAPSSAHRVQARAQRMPVRTADVVVSSLPFTSMSDADAAGALESLRRTAPRIVLYQYSKSRLALVRRYFPTAQIVGRVFANLPPAYVVASTIGPAQTGPNGASGASRTTRRA